MQGCNGAGLDQFTEEEISKLLYGLKVGDWFEWKGEPYMVTNLNPFKCHPE